MHRTRKNSWKLETLGVFTFFKGQNKFQLGIGATGGSKKDAKVKYSIEPPCDDVVNENIENQAASPPDQHILTEKNENKATASEPTVSASEGAKLNSKMDMIMKTLVLLDKRLTLVEDQLRKQNQTSGK